MNTLSLNAEILQALSHISNNESLQKEVLNFIKKLIVKQEKENQAVETYHEKTKQELIDDMQEVCSQIKLARAGKIKGRPLEEVLNEL